MTWTDDRTTILTQCWQDGLSASQIAQRLGGVTRNAVIGKVHRLGLAGRANTSRRAGSCCSTCLILTSASCSTRAIRSPWMKFGQSPILVAAS